MKRTLILILLSFATLSCAGHNGSEDSTPGSDDKTMMLDVKADGDWYFYTALDMGWKVTNRIKVISKDGKIADAHIHESVHPLLDAEAIRVVMKSPKWKPAMKDGKPVRVSYTMPVMFYFGN